MTKFRRRLTLVTTAALCAWPSLVLACEGCKSSAQSGGSPNAIGEAFGVSIYFMLAVPALIMFGLIRLMIRQCRALDEQHARVLAPVSLERSARELGEMGAAMGAAIPAR